MDHNTTTLCNKQANPRPPFFQNRVYKQGMLMMDHRRVSTAADLARVWVHETRRVFADRLISYEDKRWFEDLSKKQGQQYLGLDWDETIGAPGTDRSFLMYADFLIPGAEPKVS